MTIQFYIRYSTSFGESLWLSGNINELGNNVPENAMALEYLNDDFWVGTINIKKKDFSKAIIYSYIFQNKDGIVIREFCVDRKIDLYKKGLETIQVVDTWNYAGAFENTFFSSPFKEILFIKTSHQKNGDDEKIFSHVFNVKAPLVEENEIVCVCGSDKKMAKWSTVKPLLLSKNGDWWTIKLDLTASKFPIAYKYGVYDINKKTFVRFEDGNNRLLYGPSEKKKININHDGFVQLPNTRWKGAGVAIPVFSLRSKKGLGVGEFEDIKLLVDWSKKTGLKLIQLLPVNDTIATNTWMDSYPYSAISAFALHPLYIHLPKVAGKEFASQLSSYNLKQKQLNKLEIVDYEKVIKYKFSVLKELYELVGKKCLDSDDFKLFFADNKKWLESYAAFSFLRDKYKTPDFNQWKTNAVYHKTEIAKLCSPNSSSYKSISFYYFVQFHLHLQLKEVVDYAHKKGVVIKGDIPIGISRNSCDTWVFPELYNTNFQTGAPPDDFSDEGQNWGFPTYNWKKMREDGYAWWQDRFKQMKNYFDAFRIDHILGFFRIWSIPLHAVQGVLGHFVPCKLIHINEFAKEGIGFDYQRYCRPYITDEVLKEVFGENAETIKKDFLIGNEFDCYDLLPAFETQQKVEEYFSNIESDEDQEKQKLGLFKLISNVILLEEDGSQGQEFHFRISMQKTLSFNNLMPPIQEKLNLLYVNYFYERQDDLWYKESMEKLPALKAATNMLVCGEDLGMVPDCVPHVMRELGILSLEIQRMPKNPNSEFFHPNDAPYLSVITPSTHDMSIVREWWEENREKTQRFYNNIMGQFGEAPENCESWINRAIIMQHLYSPAMWSIFQIQDVFGMSEKLRRENPTDERINNPANPKHYWQYRMHISLEDILKEKDFNDELRDYVRNSGR